MPADMGLTLSEAELEGGVMRLCIEESAGCMALGLGSGGNLWPLNWTGGS